MFSKQDQAGYFSKKNKRSVRINSADKHFSKFVRLRDTVKIIDGVPYCKCVTCSKIAPVKEMTNGHFVKRNRTATRFNEQNCHAQCISCNSFEDGREYKHAKEIDKKYGSGTADKLQALGAARGARSKLEKYRLKEIADKYKEKVKEKEKELGILGYFK